MAIEYKDTLYEGVSHHGMQVGFVYDNIGMINVNTVDGSGIDLRVLPKQEHDVFYDLLAGTNLGSGSSFPSTKVYSDRFYRSDESKWYWWDGYDWVVYSLAYYLMLDYFPTTASYLNKGSRVFRTDEDKEYRYTGTSWVEITTTTGDTKKRIQSKDNMTVVTSTDETGSFYYRTNPTDVLLTEFWSVVPLQSYVGTGDSSAGLQVYYNKGMSPQRFICDVTGIDPSYTIDSVKFTLQSQESTPPISDIINVDMTEDVSGDFWYYDVAAFTGGLYYRKFVINYHYTTGIPPFDETHYDSITDELTGVIGRLTAEEYDMYTHTAAYAYLRYVSKTGSDSNGGTSTTDAWLTIGKAVSTVTAGTLVKVSEGTYNESLYALVITTSGTSTSPIHYYADGDVTITGTGVQFNGAAYTIIDGFRFEGVVAYTDYQCRIQSSDDILVINCVFPDRPITYDDGLYVFDSSNVFIISNTFENVGNEGYSYAINASNASYPSSGVIILYNTITSPYPWKRDVYTTVSTGDNVNGIGNYLAAASSIEAGDDCIGTTSYTYGNITDTKPVVTRGATHDKAYAINWLTPHMMYGIGGIISYTFSPMLRHVKLVNVPNAGTVRPHSMVSVIDGNSNERRVAYSKYDAGSDYGGCQVSADGEILDGMSTAKIQNINGTYYSISPISRIFDRNANDDIVIQGRSIVRE